MQREELRALQAPLKERYAQEPETALVTLSAAGVARRGRVAARFRPDARWRRPACIRPAVATGRCSAPATCCLEALVACAGVTLRAVATSLGIEVSGGEVRAEGDLDFRGTLGVDRQAPVGFSAIRLAFELDTDAGEEELGILKKLTERYCVVYQTLAGGPALTTSLAAR